MRGLPLRVVCSWEVPSMDYAGAAFAPLADLSGAARDNAEGAVAEAVAKLDNSAGVTIEAVAVQGHPSNVLLDQAEDAFMLVVGTRGLSTLKGIVRGSVSQALAHHCPIPLLIVPAPPS